MNKITVLILFLLLNLSLNAYERILDACAIFKNEARFLKEWIEFHRLVGVQEFWLYNNNSEDNYLEVLDTYIQKGIVHLIEWPSQMKDNDWAHHSFEVQTGSYNDCINRVKGHVKWLAIIDIDEFIVPVCSGCIPDILEVYLPDASGVCVNWIKFGTSRVEEIRPDELMIEKLTMRSEINNPQSLIYKSIIQPMHAVSCPNPHYCEYSNQHWHVNTDREKVSPCNNHKVCIDKLRINHYWSKDEKFFREQKIPRYIKWGHDPNDPSGLIQAKEELNREVDYEIQRFVPDLKLRMLDSN